MAKARVIGPRIDVQAAKALVDDDQALIVDVVASHVWPSMSRTIPGSLRIPPEEIQTRYAELPRDKIIILYCT